MSQQMELIKLLGTRFIQRRDVKSFQSPNGGWYPDKSPMSLQDFKDHLNGTKTLGHYMVDPGTQTCKLFAFDIDIRKPNEKEGYIPLDLNGNPYNPREAWLQDGTPQHFELLVQARSIAEGFATRVHSLMSIPVAIAYTGGKGFHVYCFTGTIPADAARKMAHGIMTGWSCFEPSRGDNFWRHKQTDLFPDIEIETFPKQGHVDEDGFGNLMALPLGINQVTKKEKFFVTTRTELKTIGRMNAIRALEGDLPWE